MKKLLMIPLLLSMAACSTSSRAPASKINCEKLEKDSDAKLVELQKVFSVYQEINYDLAIKLAPNLREETDILDARVKKLKARCWPKENKAVDNELVALKSELTKVYGDDLDAPKKLRVPANQTSTPRSARPRIAAPAQPIEEQKPASTTEHVPETPLAEPATPAAVDGDQYE